MLSQTLDQDQGQECNGNTAPTAKMVNQGNELQPRDLPTKRKGAEDDSPFELRHQLQKRTRASPHSPDHYVNESRSGADESPPQHVPATGRKVSTHERYENSSIFEFPEGADDNSQQLKRQQNSSGGRNQQVWGSQGSSGSRLAPAEVPSTANSSPNNGPGSPQRTLGVLHEQHAHVPETSTSFISLLSISSHCLIHMNRVWLSSAEKCKTGVT